MSIVGAGSPPKRGEGAVAEGHLAPVGGMLCSCNASLRTGHATVRGSSPLRPR